MAYTCGSFPCWVTLLGIGEVGLDVVHWGGCESSHLCNSPCCGELDKHEFPHNTCISLCLCFLLKAGGICVFVVLQVGAVFEVAGLSI